MNDEYGKELYPSGSCTPANIAVEQKIIHQLQIDAKQKHILKGAYTTSPVPLACIRASSNKQFQALKKQANGVLSWIWPTPCGRVTSYSIIAPNISNKKIPLARIFVPTDENFSKMVYADRHFYFFIIFKDKCTRFYKVEFRYGPNGLDPLAVTNKNNSAEIIYRDDHMAYWLTVGYDKDSHWSKSLSEKDSLSVEWAKCALRKLQKMQSEFIESGLFPQGRPKIGY